MKLWKDRIRAYTFSPRGKQQIPEYRVYRQMLSRCFNPNVPHYGNYGGRGVTVCSQWLGKQGYQNFVAAMGRRPKKFRNGRAVYSLGRINNALLYSPKTCEWQTQAQQCAPCNRRRTA
jgi:hypothetical protein